MKKMLKIAVFFVANVVIAVPTQPFQSWEELIQESPDIIIASCLETPKTEVKEPSGVIREFSYGGIQSDIKVIYVLKGQNVKAPNTARLVSSYLPHQSETYLVFSHHYNDSYQAIEPYRIVPLGMNFYTNELDGKTLEQQIQLLLQRRLNDLNRQMAEEREEKQRLEEYLKK